MLTLHELFQSVAIPAIVSAIIGLIGRCLNCTPALPLAAGTGFLAGYALLGMPALPPANGSDWLFWLTLPMMLIGMVDAAMRTRCGKLTEAAARPGDPQQSMFLAEPPPASNREDDARLAVKTTEVHVRPIRARPILARNGWLLGGFSGIVALVLIWPLVRSAAVSVENCVETAIALAVVGALMALMMGKIEAQIGAAAIAWGMCIVVGATSVTVMSSNLRTVGTYGLAAASALGPVALLAGRNAGGQSVGVLAFGVLAGLITCGHFYPDPGMSWTQSLILILSPALLAIGAFVPSRRTWVRAAVALLAVTVTVACVAAPAAMAAKKAAETDASDPVSESTR